MSEPKLISPMLDHFIMGDPLSEHHGVRCCPAIENNTQDRYIVKIISVPANSAKLEALLLSGAFSSKEAALAYFKEQAHSVRKEVDTLEKLAELEGFIGFSDCQMVPMDSGEGFDIYLLSSYKRTLQKHFKRHSFTHLDALNLGMDLCAALNVARRNGYLYVDLKPSNVFVSDQRLFRIGDLGFIPLNSLKYTSVPEKYLSTYTPPEIRDAFSALNLTMDTYAAGLILYQAYNNGELPFNDEILPGDQIPAPLYADYEMSEIILKACAPNPEDRWQDPMEMGQAIISYMQRNGAKDTPIVPMPTAESAEEEAQQTQIEEIQAELPAEESSTPEAEDILVSEEEITEEIIPEEEMQEEIADEPEVTEPPSAYLDSATEDVPDDEEIPEDYKTLTDETTQMLEQADELVSHEIPEPVVVPDHVDIPIPVAEAPIEEETFEISEMEDIQDSEEAEDTDAEVEDIPVKQRNYKRWILVAVGVLLAAALIVGGIFFYKNYYLLPIDYIAVEGSDDKLTVYITTDIDESLLQVICSDTYGNKIPAPVINGKAEFTGLIPNTAYNIRVIANGFHRLTGIASTAYSTPIQTNIVHFDAITGTTPDSVILSFTLEGPECNEWMVEYSAEGEEPRTATFTSHLVTLTNLTVGKEYTFRLIPSEPLYLSGMDQIVYTPRSIVTAEHLNAASNTDGKLVIQWSIPEGEEVASWSVRCSNDNYNQTIITTSPAATFEGIDAAAEYTIEVKAAGMSISEVITVPANAITAGDFSVDTTDPTKIALSWQPTQNAPEDGWLLRYSIKGIDNDITVSCDGNSAVISPVVPNATYFVQVEDIKGNILLGSSQIITTQKANDFTKEFSGFTAQRSDLEFTMCKPPVQEDWGRYDLSDEDYTSTFSVGDTAAFLVRFPKLYSAPKEDVTIVYVVRNQEGTPILSSANYSTWRQMWSTSYCKLTLPAIPAAAGTYHVEIYFNGMLAHGQEFTVS